MNKRPECRSCELGRNPATHRSNALCGSCAKDQAPQPFCLVEKADDEFLRALLRTDDLPDLLRRLKALLRELSDGEFAVMHWSPNRGYRPLTPSPAENLGNSS